ncbi:MAG TPA: hypothetical protein VJT49_33555 [Amycolatopsis sp.]|uniref:DUF7715 family protein n=1 Tax=Amycolatopsis sp. TaxID=37632 RepID=UPI002B4754E2|nr:hypothetical protein [Amycolatopsis sp.]HKS49951.1 hypothetical protein [Amycolatopsis sp.]
MNILVATARTQGARANDYHFCTEGELVWIGLMCRRGQDDPDGSCGCGRGFGGLNSHKATTTAMVADLPGFTRADYVLAIRSSLADQGWPPSVAEEIADDQLGLARQWPPGTVIERRLDYVQARIMASGKT